MTKFAVAVRNVKMHFSHDKHQYFFEKYLRKEMLGEELDSFEKKLSENQKFRADFDYYVKNRKEIVQVELAEYDEPELLIAKPQKWGWVYASISVLCLVLIVDYFINSYYSEKNQIGVQRKPLIEKMNFFKKPENPELPTDITKEKITTGNKAEPSPSIAPEDSSELIKQSGDNLLPYMEGNRMAIQGDYFVADSIFGVIENSVIQERTQMLRIQTDSLLDDSSLNELVLKSFIRKPIPGTRQLLVEYWESPIHFRGYLFNGKKLLLYGIDPTTLFYLSFWDNNSYHIILKGKEFHLFSDNQFHQLAEE